MHEAEKYLRENQAGSVFVRYRGNKRRLFITSCGEVCMVRKGDEYRGEPFSDWKGVSKIYIHDSETLIQRKLVRLYRREARKAPFTNSFIRLCLQADTDKSLYENGITTGNWNEGGIISLASIAKVAPLAVEAFESAFKQSVPYISWCFPFLGYECFLEVTVSGQGEATGQLTLEYKGYFYYYRLINDKNFIGYDVD